MDKKAEVTYNPQLGYLKTVFTHNFDFLTEIREYRQEGQSTCVQANLFVQFVSPFVLFSSTR